MAALQVIPTEHLVVDPDVQVIWALAPRRVARLAKEWNENFAGPLVVVPHGDIYSIIDGRHRFLAGRERGMVEWRCDVHRECESVADKASLKMAIDGDRRRVTRLERFVVGVAGGDPMLLEIQGIVEKAGFHVGGLKGGRPYDRIESVGSLEFLHKRIGAAGLRRTLRLNTLWLNTPQSTKADWLRALGLLIRDGYDDALKDVHYKRWKELVPGEIMRVARGELVTIGAEISQGTEQQWGTLSYATARNLRKKAGLRARPVQEDAGPNAQSL